MGSWSCKNRNEPAKTEEILDVHAIIFLRTSCEKRKTWLCCREWLNGKVNSRLSFIDISKYHLNAGWGQSSCREAAHTRVARSLSTSEPVSLPVRFCILFWHFHSPVSDLVSTPQVFGLGSDHHNWSSIQGVQQPFTLKDSWDGTPADPCDPGEEEDGADGREGDGLQP